MSDDPVRLHVDPESCITGGVCEMLEPEVFALGDDDTIVSVIGTGTLPRDRAEIVVERCPGRAISMVEDTDSIAEDTEATEKK